MGRDLFAELNEGMKALADERLGRRTLRIVRRQLSERVRNSKLYAQAIAFSPALVCFGGNKASGHLPGFTPGFDHY